MAILFIAGIPTNTGKSSSGGNVLLGIAEALCKYADEDLDLVSYPIVPSFPAGKLWIPAFNDKLENGKIVRFLPTLNLKIVKSKLWGWQSARIIRDWANNHKGEELKVLIYNTYHPSVDSIYHACKSHGIKLYSILQDLGMPSKQLGLSRLTMFGYKMAEKTAKKYIPLLDGRIIINELIEKYYAPGKDYILIDGGVNNHVVNKLFPLTVNEDDVYTFVIAGLLWAHNGTQLLLDAMAQYSNPKVRVVFAGKGNDVELIEQAASKDSRISYAGMLNMEELFKLYEKSDVLLNLRLEEEIDFHFPGKLLEYLATGRYVISTPVAHAERDYGEYMSILHDKTPEGLIQLMESIQKLGKQELFKVGQKARQFMLEQRTWDFQTKRIIEYMSKNKKI